MFEKGSLNGKLERTAASPVMPIIDNNKSEDCEKRRGPEDIKAEILVRALNYAQKTEIMFHCGLSFAQLKDYTRILIGNGLLSMEGEKRKQVFKTTERGKAWLVHFKRMRAIENGAELNDTTYIT